MPRSLPSIARSLARRTAPRDVSIAGALLALAICVGSEGARAIGDTAGRAAADVTQLVTMGAFATCAMVVTASIAWRLGWELQRARDAASTDALTVVANRRAFEERFELEFERAKIAAMPLTLMLVDVDELKAINDREGHEAGDRALRAVARALAKSCRSRDVVARWGGDEFGVLMARTRAHEALAVATRVHAALRKEEARVSVSIGVADVDPAAVSRAAALFQAADRALLRAKQKGRDCTCLADSSDRSERMIIPPIEPGSRARVRIGARRAV